MLGVQQIAHERIWSEHVCMTAKPINEYFTQMA